MRIKVELIVFAFFLIFIAVPASAQQKGQYIPGQEGLNTGVLPDPGFTYANINPQLLGGHSQERKRKLCSSDWLLRHMCNRERLHLCSEVLASGRKYCFCGCADACKRISDPRRHQFPERGGQWRRRRPS